MKKKLALLLVLVMSLLTPAAQAVVKQGEDFYYLDTAGVLSEEAEGTIYFCNQMLEEACGGQIVVAVLDSLGGASTIDYALELFDSWGIGSAETNNGFLLLMSVEDEDYFTAYGIGVDDIFGGYVMHDLFRMQLEPFFAVKDYEAGALQFFRTVLEMYIDHYGLDFRYEDGRSMALRMIAGRKAKDSLKENGG